MPEKNLLEGSCHCGAIQLRLPAIPDKATRCNCSLCRRLGTVWAYFELGAVQIEGHPENTEAYIQGGEATLKTMRCKTCGCVTHWDPIDPAQTARQGVNLNNFAPALLAKVPVRRFDGADSWTFLD